MVQVWKGLECGCGLPKDGLIGFVRRVIEGVVEMSCFEVEYAESETIKERSNGTVRERMLRMSKVIKM